MSGIINFEYLISPVLGESSSMEVAVNNLRLLSNLLSAGLININVEKDIISKMTNHGYFPSSNIFQKGISSSSDKKPFSANDIVRIVNIILSNSIEMDDFYAIDWETPPQPMPDIASISDMRKMSVLESFRCLAVANSISENKYYPLYYSKEKNCHRKVINFKGKIIYVFPETLNKVPFDFDGDLETISNINILLSHLDGFELFKQSNTDLQLKLAFYVGSLSLIKNNNLSSTLEWDDFSIGSAFRKSLIENEAYQDQQFASVVYNSIINVLASTEKEEVKYFYKSDDPKSPRTHGKYTAYRVHITKQARALRLLFWADDLSIILSNIGNKNECIINNP